MHELAIRNGFDLDGYIAKLELAERAAVSTSTQVLSGCGHVEATRKVGVVVGGMSAGFRKTGHTGIDIIGSIYSTYRDTKTKSNTPRSILLK